MKITVNMYRCPKCKKNYEFDASQDYEAICSKCNMPLNFLFSSELDTDKKPEETPVMSDEQFRQFLKALDGPQVTCPYCKSTRVSGIGILERMVSVEFWGFASDKLGKQWHCHDCGSNF